MTENGCKQCGENTYSSDEASSCTSCPDDMISAAGSTSEADCEYGRFGQIINLIPIIEKLNFKGFNGLFNASFLRPTSLC